MRGPGGARRDCVVYVGELPDDVREREVEDLFWDFGRIVNIDLKTQGRPPAYAFIEFDHPRDAMDAVRARDNYRFGRSRLRVEIARGATGPPAAPPNWRKKGTGFRIVVEGLPRHASWQDLKDMFRKVETPVYTNVYSDSKGIFGVVEYNTHRELLDVMRAMRNAEFKNPFCEPTPVYLMDDTDEGDRDAGAPAASASPPRDERRSRERERERSRSPREREDARSRSRSRSRSRDRD